MKDGGKAKKSHVAAGVRMQASFPTLSEEHPIAIHRLLGNILREVLLWLAKKAEKNEAAHELIDLPDLQLQAPISRCHRLHVDAVHISKEQRPVTDTLAVQATGHQAKLSKYIQLLVDGGSLQRQ